MKNRLKILMAFSEVAPFSKTGGLGDVGGALPKVLKEMGHDVRVITPQYRAINERKYVLREVIRLQDIEIAMGDTKITVNVKSAFLPNSKVQVYFMDYRPYFFREGLYTNPKTHSDYPDNAQRYILFCKGVLETLKKLQWQPDVIHCNDWQTGMIPFLLKNYYHNDSFFSKINTLFTVHNFAFQGNFNQDCLDFLGLPSDFIFNESSLYWYGQCSFLKAGLFNADCINTVSMHHAEEAAGSEKYGFGMEKVIKTRPDRLEGVLNGVDYQVWNPETDNMIPHQYSIEDISGKALCKKNLLEELQLKVDEQTPVVAMITRLTEQKGVHLVEEIFPKLMDLSMAFVLLGMGEKRFHDYFKKMAHKYSKKVSVHFKFDDPLAHRIIAGSDFFLMPSMFEPCGLTQLFALKYGTIPIAFETGGLVDTIRDFHQGNSDGTGFLFKKPTAKALFDIIKKGVTVFNDRKIRNCLIINGMKMDFSWEKSATQYVQLYQKCISR